MRLFIAIGFKEAAFFRKIQNRMDRSSARLKFTDIYHLTLKFLGEVREQRLQEIKKGLSKISFQPFQLTASHLGFFPCKNNIRIIWLGFDISKELESLHQNIESALASMFRKEKRKFHPHVTLARVKSVRDRAAFLENIESIAVQKKPFNIDKFSLIKSTLTKKRPVYECMDEYLSS
ncbi:RNA 2',3'-cyclic phosphodiesterase [Candidatus Woesearchaeota archaeon]|nr:RNA 2',3'-cyclic phosphodiesterase [Candidatus Woesearchaeota archaeon]